MLYIIDFGGSVKVSTLNDFVDDGGNVLAGADSSIGEPIREFAAECGVEYDEVSLKCFICLYLTMISISLCS